MIVAVAQSRNTDRQDQILVHAKNGQDQAQPLGQPKYEVMRGRPVEVQVPVQAAQPVPPAQIPEHEFPRNKAQNSRQGYQERQASHPRVQVHQPRVKVNQPAENPSQNDLINRTHQPHANVSQTAPEVQERVQVQAGETIFVRNIAELFSPKEDIEADLGVTQDQLDHMVSAYKKTREHKERPLPMNKHFSVEGYNESKNTIRNSALNAVGTFGSKRGTIVKEIYRKYGKNFAKQPVQSQNSASVMASIPSAETTAQIKDTRDKRRNPGYLTVRT